MKRKLSLKAFWSVLVLVIVLAAMGQRVFAESKLQILEVDKPKNRKEHHYGGTWSWSDKWVKVRIRNRYKEWVPIEVSLSAYDRDKKFIDTWTRFSVAHDDRKRYDRTNNSIEGKKTITIWFRFHEAFLRRQKPKYYEVKLLKDGRIMDRRTAPKSFLEDLKKREKARKD